MEDQVRYLHLLGNPFSGIQQAGDRIEKQFSNCCTHLSFNMLTDYNQDLPVSTGSSIENRDGAVHALLVQETRRLATLRKNKRSRGTTLVITSGFLQTPKQVRLAKLLGVLDHNSGYLFFRTVRAISREIWIKEGKPVLERTFTRVATKFELDSPTVAAALCACTCRGGEVYVASALMDSAFAQVLHVAKVQIGMPLPSEPNLRIVPDGPLVGKRGRERPRFNPVPRVVDLAPASVSV